MRFILSCVIVLFVLLSTRVVWSCESCAVASLGKKDRYEDSRKLRVKARVVYESQDWKESEAMPLHEMHHDGYHVHDKQNEEIIHTLFSIDIHERFGIDVDIPYVTKHYIEIDSHHHAGENQRSTGLGDIMLTGDYRFIQTPEHSYGIIAGLKLPTGRTTEHNAFGVLMEPELQPGTGSLDYIGGLSAAFHQGDIDLQANTIYIYRTQGAQDFRAGDLFSVTLNAARTFDLPRSLQLKAGAVLNSQLEKKQNNEDGFVKDSGGYTMFLGPQLTLTRQRVSVEWGFLFPVIQKLGGVHQELDRGIWTLSCGVNF